MSKGTSLLRHGHTAVMQTAIVKAGMFDTMHVPSTQMSSVRQCVTETGTDGLVRMRLVQHNSLELGLEPLDRVLLCNAVGCANLNTAKRMSSSNEGKQLLHVHRQGFEPYPVHAQQ